MSEEELLFADDEADSVVSQTPAEPQIDSAHPWKVMVVDDEQSIHDVTRLSLRKVTFEQRPLELIHAYSGEEAVQQLQQHPDVALILLDVVMESDDAGLKAIKQIRQTEKNELVRIVLRTGQPGSAPAHQVIVDYDINDYKDKSELTSDKLFTCVISSLRGYQGLQKIQHHQQVKQQLLAEKEANRAKDDFLAAMSHELRTPLTALLGNGELLSSSGLNHDQQKLLESMDVSGKGLLYLINDLLDVSKIAAGKFTIDDTEFDLDALLDEIKTIFYKRAEEARLSFKVSSSLHCSTLLRGDGHRISQILINLLGNAVKFTEQGSVTLTISELEAIDGSELPQLSMVVQDQGIGISPEVMEQLFQPFEQGDSSISRRFGGTGLGLYISRQLVDLMGGSIHVDSVAGQGARFEVRLPLRFSETPVQLRISGQQHSLPANYQGTVLIAEDAPELQLLEQRMVERYGLKTRIARNGEEAVELALAKSFDLILMDMQMPLMDGIEATRQLRRAGCTTPIVALTANVMPRHREQFKQAGCDHFLEKPINRSALEQVLTTHLHKGAEPVQELDDLIDDELYQLFIERSRVLHQEMMAAFEVSSWAEVRSAAHTIKGSGTTFGYPDLTRMGAEVCITIDADNHAEAATAVEQLHQVLQQISGPLPT
ncbi:MAG: response regulator [Gammaproteobacteria bacterium]|jgi:signal transduction histidine kinase/AmiR/NasT family two-component response regulator|nr:response regulator [Gammaproteobacteria bacterium]MBT4606007.1 response regulator [Thiotrichales bacterium]MBT3473596.1 response regulator [Gammaproteobacteria bacterium]MBT3967930.1 response regulator [Gammaproteobacteria bacterium]MBT4081913.1 response regulator [Gammaproteobacteria bacterium]